MILALVDYDRGELDPLSPALLTFGRRLADRLDSPLEAVLLGEQARPLVHEAARYGASTVHLVEHAGLDEYAPAAWAESVVQLMAAGVPQAVLAAGTDRGNEVLAHVAARAELPMAANCTEVEPGDPYRVTRVRWGGSLLEEAELDGAIKLLTVMPLGVEPEERDGSGDVAVAPFVPQLSDRDLAVRVSGRVEREPGAVSLPAARVVVGGGRGLGSAEGFGPLDELAELLAGAVGCSRAVTSLGWRPHSDQIGQTGTRIAPELYIACGISGAIQHMVGCKAAKRILVVNTDPQAPILARADYAVIGDAGQVVTALNAELRKARELG